MKLQEGENIVHELKPEPKILWIWFFTRCLPLCIIGIATAGLVATFLGTETDVFESGSVLKWVIVGVLWVAFLTSIGVVYCIYLRRTYVYYVTTQRCVFHGGILRRVERSVPYHKITDVEMSQNIIERVLGISTLNIFTPGTGSMYPGSPFGGQRAEVSFVGLTDNEAPAATINEILRKFKATGE